MDISFKNKRLEKSFNEGARLDKIHGKIRAKKIRIRMQELRAAKSLMDFWPPKSPPGRCHELTEGKGPASCPLIWTTLIVLFSFLIMIRFRGAMTVGWTGPR